MKDEHGNGIKGATITVRGVRHDITTGNNLLWSHNATFNTLLQTSCVPFHWTEMNNADVNECWCSLCLSLQLRMVITGDCWIQVSTLLLQLPLATLKYPSALTCQGTFGWAEWTLCWRRPHENPLLTTLTSLSWTIMSVLTHLISLSNTARGSWERMERRELRSPGGGLILAS